MEYNRKTFIAPDDLHSFAAIQCKISPDKNGEQIASVRISDCHNSIKLWNKANDKDERLEFLQKLNNVIIELLMFHNYIEGFKEEPLPF
ncbi:MAG: hypothetical protein LBE36_13350 [Flavobacteriaceae bacterium]|nr:hypothetical protein [Flavobacteriaceae bacterium]